jgi:hypothetical protein
MIDAMRDMAAWTLRLAITLTQREREPKRVWKSFVSNRLVGEENRAYRQETDEHTSKVSSSKEATAVSKANSSRNATTNENLDPAKCGRQLAFEGPKDANDGVDINISPSLARKESTYRND